jgi:hypothetical protein
MTYLAALPGAWGRQKSGLISRAWAPARHVTFRGGVEMADDFSPLLLRQKPE